MVKLYDMKQKKRIQTWEEFDVESQRNLEATLERSRIAFAVITQQYLSVIAKMDNIRSLILSNHAMMLKHHEAIKELQRTQR